MGCTACTEPQCLYKGTLYLTVELYLYSPYGQYGLYRASVPVQGCTLPYSRAIPLLPLWAVRPVQSLSACTGCTLPYSRAIPLLPLWAVRPVQSLSARTREHFSIILLLNCTVPNCTDTYIRNKSAKYQLTHQTRFPFEGPDRYL